VYVDGAFVEPRAAATAAFAASHHRVFECAACCHDLKPAGDDGQQRWIGDPMEVALVAVASTTRVCLGSFEALAAMAAFFFVLTATGWQWGQELSVTDIGYRQATTACLTAIVLMQVVNVHVCRSRRTSIISRPFFGNSLIAFGIVAEVGLILAIDYTAFGDVVFGTAPIGYEAWLVALPFAVVMLTLEEAHKRLRHHWRDRRKSVTAP
jgi:magnesium-transporting ATPase (P-type)